MSVLMLHNLLVKCYLFKTLYSEEVNGRSITVVFVNRYVKKIAGIYIFIIPVLLIYCNRSVVTSTDNEMQIGEMTDIDGNVYRTIRIGKQTWMAENLRVTRYNDGEKINQINELLSWGLDTIGAFCFYNNTANIDTIRKYGALYNYYTVASQ